MPKVFTLAVLSDSFEEFSFQNAGSLFNISDTLD